MNETAMWAVGIVIAVLLGSLGFMVKFSLDQLKESFKTLIFRIDRITTTLEAHNDKLITILSKHEITTEWIDNHEQRLDDVEKNIHKIEIDIATNSRKIRNNIK